MNRRLTWITIVGLSFTLHKLSDWFLLRISNVEGVTDFGDLKAVLKSAVCAEGDLGTLVAKSELATKCGYIYGEWFLRTLSMTPLTESHGFLVAWFLIGLLAVVLGMYCSVLYRHSRLLAYFALICVNSPPVILLIERANLDILIYLLIAISAWGMSRSNLIMTLLPLSTASMTKFYSLPLLFLVALKQRSALSRWTTSLIAVLVSLKVGLELIGSEAQVPRPTFVAFGLPVFGLYLDYFGIQTHPRVHDALGLILLSCSGAVIWQTQRKSWLRVPKCSLVAPCESYESVMNCLCASTFLICYVLGSNYDYRLILLLIPALSFIKETRDHNFTSVMFISTTILAMWGSINLVIQPIGDIAILFWASVLAFSIFSEVGAVAANFRSAQPRNRRT